MKDSDNGPRRVSDRSDSDDATVARLLRLAGHRPAVPARDAEMVKQAARAEWQRTARAQRRRIFYARGTGGLLAAAALVLLTLNTDLLRRVWPGPGGPVATVEMATGQVRAAAGEGGLADLALGATLLPGTTVETGASGAGVVPARVAFRLADGTSIRLDKGTRVRVLSGSVLALDRGALYADSGPVAPASGRALEIRTPIGIARDVGTQFLVRLDDPAHDLEVQVREGKVILNRDGEAAETVESGIQLAVLPDGSVERTDLPRFGGPWDWLLAVVPPFQVENASVNDVLEWAARESGWQVSYADSSLERQAAVPLEGSIAGMTPEEAAIVALMASDLDYRLEDGVFQVQPAE